MRSFLFQIITTVCLLANSAAVVGHGGVALTDDVCVMSLGNLSAHFALYQPETQKSKEFCEDVPDVANSLFVIDFIHDNLAEMDVDFRILNDVDNVGLSAAWADVQAIEDLQPATEHYQPPAQYANGSMTVEHAFTRKGTYIGVIEARDPVSGKVYRAVFPFRVGAKDFWDYLPYFIALVLLLELFYWLSNGGWGRWRARRSI